MVHYTLDAPADGGKPVCLLDADGKPLPDHGSECVGYSVRNLYGTVGLTRERLGTILGIGCKPEGESC